VISVTVTLPVKVQSIISLLAQNGFDGYAVGGCVRDSLLGKTPHDWDICTPATPEDMLRVFDGLRVIETGLKHGTLTVLLDGEPFEVTTYRIDGEYLDNRRPSSVRFIGSLADDLSRRDFTINAMAYNDQAGLIDPFSGAADLKTGLIRCVGKPDHRFGEDALRILRALRFASVFGFSLEPETTGSIHRNKELLQNISAERISVELGKLLCGVGAGDILRSCADVIAVFIPEITPMFGFEQQNPYHCFDVWEHTVTSITKAPEDLTLRLVMLLHDIAKPSSFTTDETGRGHFHGHPEKSAALAELILKRLKYDNLTIDTVKTLVLHHDVKVQPTLRAVKRLLNKIGPDNFKALLLVKLADYSAQNPDYFALRVQQLDELSGMLDTVLKERQCFSMKDLAVTGSDLLALGIPQGEQLGQVLKTLLEMVISDEAPNSRDELMTIAKNIVNR
jgi:tRNA nucleotidyltransferase (CCA-adding enzyme)